MSNNPWPFVIVALTSLGFLANSMAQQSNRLPQDDKSPIATRFGGLAEPEIAPNKSSVDDSNRKSNRWSQASQNPSDPAQINDASPLARLGEIETTPPASRKSFDSNSGFGDRFGSLNNTPLSPEGSNAAAGAVLEPDIDYWNSGQSPEPGRRELRGSESPSRDTREELAQRIDLVGPENMKRRSPQIQQRPYPYGRSQQQLSQQVPFKIEQPQDKVRPPTRQDYYDAKFNEQLFTNPSTHSTTVSIESPQPLGRSTLKANQSLSSAGQMKAQSHEEGSDPLPAKAGAARGPDDQPKSNLKLPLWSTMALFASLAANLFFGWVAWDTHARYQDFVEEANESDSVRERQSRRLRDEPRQGRRTRESEEAEFLNGGIEV